MKIAETIHKDATLFGGNVIKVIAFLSLCVVFVSCDDEKNTLPLETSTSDLRPKVTDPFEIEMDLAAENDIVVMDAGNGLRWDMQGDDVEKLEIKMVREGKMNGGYSVIEKLADGTNVVGMVEMKYAYGLLCSYTYSIRRDDGKQITQNDMVTVSRRIRSIYPDAKYNVFSGNRHIWVKDNHVVTMEKSDYEMSISYYNMPVYYTLTTGDEDLCKSIVKSLLPPETIHLYLMKDGAVGEVMRHARLSNAGYKSLEWGPVVKKNNGYYVRHMYECTPPVGGKSINNSMFHLRLDGEIIDEYPVTGSKYVYK